MKRILILATTFVLFEISSIAQLVDNGWYYFRNPSANIFGLGFNTPKKNKELKYVGSEIDVKESELTILKGPDETFHTTNNWKKLIITSLFSNSNNISLTVKTFMLKRVLLPANRWRDFDAKNYYIIEALRADSVFITGKIIRSTEVDSKKLEEIISKFVTGNTVAFKVIDALSNKDTTVNSKGIISFETGRKDSFAIVIRQPDIYFASKFVQLKSNAYKAYWQTPAAHPYENESQEFDLNQDNQFVVLQHYFSNLHANGVNIKLVFEYDESNKLAKLIFNDQKVGSPTFKSTVIETAAIKENKIISFDGEYPYLTNPQSSGLGSSEKFLTLIDYKLNFDPKTKKLVIFGYQTIGNQATYQTCIYQIKNKFKYWPK